MKSLKGIIKSLKGFVDKTFGKEALTQIHVTEEGYAMASDGYRIAGVKVDESIKACTIPNEYVAAKQNTYTEEEIQTIEYNDNFGSFKRILLAEEAEGAKFEIKAGDLLKEFKRLYKAQCINRLNEKSGFISFIMSGDKLEMQFKANSGVQVTREGQKFELKGNIWLSKDLTNMVKFTLPTKKELRVTLNAKYVYDALSILDKKDVAILGFNKTFTPVILNTSTAKNLILPVRLREDQYLYPVKPIEVLEEEIAKIEMEHAYREKLAKEREAQTEAEEVTAPSGVEYQDSAEEVTAPSGEKSKRKSKDLSKLPKVEIKTVRHGHSLGEGHIIGETKKFIKVEITTHHYSPEKKGTILKFDKITGLCDMKYMFVSLETELIPESETVHSPEVAPEPPVAHGPEAAEEDNAPVTSTPAKRSTQILSRIKNVRLLYEIATLLNHIKTSNSVSIITQPHIVRAIPEWISLGVVKLKNLLPRYRHHSFTPHTSTLAELRQPIAYKFATNLPKRPFPKGAYNTRGVALN